MCEGLEREKGREKRYKYSLREKKNDVPLKSITLVAITEY